MDPKVVPTIITVAIIALAFWGMWAGWRRRTRRQNALLPELAAPPASLGAASADIDGLYAATTTAADPLDRIAARGLGFRARSRTSVHPEGVVIERDGSEPLFIPAAALDGAHAADATIDKGVERGGLAAIDWSWGSLHLTTFLRPRASNGVPVLIDAVRGITPTPEA